MQRDLHVLADPRGAQRGQDPDRRVQPAEHVGERRADLQRRPVGLAGDRHQPADRLRSRS